MINSMLVIMYHNTGSNKLLEKILKTGLKPSKSGFYGPGLYAWTDAKMAHAPCVKISGDLKLWDGSKPIGVKQSVWNTARSKGVNYEVKLAIKHGYDAMLHGPSNNAILVFSNAIDKLILIEACFSDA